MKSFGKYITRYFVSFAGVVLLLVLGNVVAFGWTFHDVITKDYGDVSPQAMLDETAASASVHGISEEAAQKLRNHEIWAAYLDSAGTCRWTVDAPESFPDAFTIQDVALFSKGYLDDYPVFVRNMKDGLLLLGYPKDSYMKVTSNYFSIRFIKAIPLFALGMLAVDFILLFMAYYFSRRSIIRNTEPIITSLEALSNGRPAALSVSGELSEIAESVNRAARILNSQNSARANWISGVSHDIRTPLSMILGYAERIAQDDSASAKVRGEAEIICRQSVKIKELVQDLNLVSQLEYEMQPLRKEPVRLSGLLRACAAELLNAGLPDSCSAEIEISPAAETVVLECDARLLSRAVGNLVQNSIRHNPSGCGITLGLTCTEESIILSVTDDGVGLSEEKWRELQEKPHYLESTDDRLDLRHGLGLILVRQIAQAHGGKMAFSRLPRGCRVTLSFPNPLHGGSASPNGRPLHIL